MNDEQLRRLLKAHRTVASVGLSADVTKDSFAVAAYLKASGYHIVPVNPRADTILGERVYRDLPSIPADRRVEIVQIFRPSADVPPIVEQAIRIGAKVVWMQEGIVNEEAAAAARAAGLEVVMDACMMQAHRRLVGAPTSLM